MALTITSVIALRLHPEEAVTAAEVGYCMAADVPLEPENRATDLHTLA